MDDRYIVIDADPSEVQNLDTSTFDAQWEQRPTASSKGILRVSSSKASQVEQALKSQNFQHQTYTSKEQAQSNS